MEDMKGVAGKLESLSNSRPDMGEWINKVTSTELKVKSLADKIDDIEEEYANKMDEQGKHIRSLENKISNLECQIMKLLKIQESNTYKYIDEMQKSKINKDTKEIKEKCEICQKVCSNMKEHDENHHIKNSSSNNIEYKCDICTLTFKDKCEVPAHIIDKHRKCTHCKKIFTTEKVLETHIKAIHNKNDKKHNIEREPSLKNHKIKK